MTSFEIFLIGGALLLFTLAMVSSMRSRARRAEPAPQPRIHARQEFRESVDKLLVELTEVGREVTARLDTKIRVLNRVIEEADERIATLEKLQTRTEERASSDPPGFSPLLERHARVFELAEEGKSPVDIAQALSMEPGEIEFILQLRKGTRG